MSSRDSSHLPVKPSEPTNRPSDDAFTDSHGTSGDAAGYAGREEGVSGEERAAEPSPLLPPDQQPTVISKRAPGEDSSLMASATPLEMGKTLEGQQLGHFVLEQFVGGGGMGAVFRATDTMLGRTVAVKVLSRDHSSDEETLRRFKNEAQSAARLDHDNIARVHYVGEDGGWNYIVFEFIDGVNIRDMVVQGGPLPLGQAVSYTLQVAEALSHAARRDVVHRDIKPSNVLITHQGRAKLVDMGLARLHHVESSEGDLTASGVTLGTFDYISPEQARDPRCADVRSDLYSLGCTLYFMLTGRPPFPEGTVLQKLLSHSSDPPPDPRQFRPDLPEEVSAIIGKMLCKHPDERYQEPSELIGELLLLADRLGLSVSGQSTAVWITSRDARISSWERHLPWLVPVAVLVAVVLGIHFFSPSPDYEFVAPQNAAKARPGSPHSPDGGKGVERVRPGEQDHRGGHQAVDPPAVGDAKSTGQGSPSDGAKDDGSRVVKGDARVDAPRPAADPSDRPRPMEGFARGSPADGAGVSVAGRETAVVSASGPGSVEPMELTVGDRLSTAGAGSDAAGHDATEPSVLIVGHGGEESLGAAIGKARDLPDLEAIELHFDGVRVEKPIEFADQELTIRAGQGFTPIIAFRPKADDPVEYYRSMITLTGGQLVLEGVCLELDVPSEPADRWALFELESVKMLQMNHCVMTIRSAMTSRDADRDSSVAFFDVRRRLGYDTLTTGETTVGETLLAIDLWHCVARGEAVFLQAAEVLPLRLSWTNGLLVTTEHLFVAGGSKSAPPMDGYVTIDLHHLTAVMDAGACLLTSSEGEPYQLTVDLKCSDSILMTEPASALVRQRGSKSPEELREQFLFSGRGNFYQKTSVFWRVESTAEDGSVEQFDFMDWSKQWHNEKLPQRIVRWRQLPTPNRPVHLQTPRDYALSEHPTNPAFRSADDRSNAGFDADELPAVPQPPATSSETQDTRPADSAPST